MTSQSSGRGADGAGVLVLWSALGLVERRLQREQVPTLLGGHDAPAGERTTVAYVLDLIADGKVGTPRSEEVRVHRVGSPASHGVGGSRQRLARDVASEQSRVPATGCVAAVASWTVGRNVQEVEQDGDRCSHDTSSPMTHHDWLYCV